MVVEQLHVRLVLLVSATGMFSLLPKAVRSPERPGSNGFVLTAVEQSGGCIEFADNDSRGTVVTVIYTFRDLFARSIIDGRR